MPLFYCLWLFSACKLAAFERFLSLAVRNKENTLENKLLLFQCSPKGDKGKKLPVTSGSSHAFVIPLSKRNKE